MIYICTYVREGFFLLFNDYLPIFFYFFDRCERNETFILQYIYIILITHLFLPEATDGSTTNEQPLNVKPAINTQLFIDKYENNNFCVRFFYVRFLFCTKQFGRIKRTQIIVDVKQNCQYDKWLTFNFCYVK